MIAHLSRLENIEGDTDTHTGTDTEIKFQIQAKQNRHEFNDQSWLARIDETDQIRTGTMKINGISELL